MRKKVLKNEPITQDTFVLPFNVKNLSRKRVDGLWQKHPKDPMSVQMWVMENKILFSNMLNMPQWI
jgi:hypothetical protein